MTFIQVWLLPLALLVTATVVAFPLSRYMAWIMDGKYRPWAVFRWFEQRLDSGEQNWKQYLFSLLTVQYPDVRLRLPGPGAPALDAA